MSLKKLSSLLGVALALGGDLPSVKIPESNTRMENLHKGFKEWLFDRDTGELIDNEYMSKMDIGSTGEDINIYAVTSRSEENARKEFERMTKIKSK